MLNFTTSAKLAAISVALLLAACATDEPPAPAAAPAAGPQTAARPPANNIVPGSARDFEVNVGDRVNFDYDSSSLDDGDRGILQRQAAWLARYPAVTLSVEGHCDERGTREYNLALGARRAASVREYLVSLGVNGTRLETISYGKERPACVESNEACWAQNRRGVSTIKSGASS